MTNSFFGGDPSKAHWNVSVRSKAGRNEDPKAQRERRARENGKLKEAGFKTTAYFEFNIKNESQKELQRQRAEAYAKEVKAKTGVTLKIAEGCFL